MTTTELSDEQRARIVSRREYKRNYQRGYYMANKDTEEFKARRAKAAKAVYRYNRKTIDCASCGTRHTPDNKRCLLLQRQHMINDAVCRIDMVNQLLDTIQPESQPSGCTSETHQPETSH